VCRCERLGNLPGDRQHFADRNRHSRDSLCQILAFDKFHHEGTNSAGLFESVDLRDIGMVERSERLCLTREPRQSIGVARKGVREDLQRNVAIELRVAGAVDLPHATFADQRGDLVEAETSASGQGHEVR
jgi:hypothetical protein